jgi:hypothetical protein
LGSALDDTGQRAIQASKEQVVRVEKRCEALTLQQVQQMGHPKCCQVCWEACCSAMTQHIKAYSNYSTKPVSRYMLPRGANATGLNFPGSRGCSAQDVAVDGSCCHQLSYMQNFMPLRYPPLRYSPNLNASFCSLECAQNCGFQHEPGAARKEKELWCVRHQVQYADGGMYPLWVQQQYLVKQSTGKPFVAQSAAAKKACSLC